LRIDCYKNIEVIRVCNSKNNFLYFTGKVFLQICFRKIKPSILISGDLKLGLFSALLIKFAFLGRLKLQVSIHGIPSSGKFSGSKRITALYFYILRVSLQAVDSIRVVSDSLATFAHEQLGANSSRVFVSPIPILYLPNFKDKRAQNPTIGLIGRLHAERGLLDSLEILELLAHSKPGIEILVIGDGELRNLVQEWAFRLKHQAKIQLIGEVSQTQLQQYWGKINILLSSAPNEGYGLSIREALISGSVVVAKNSTGAKALQDQFTDGVILFESTGDAVADLINLLNDMSSVKLCNNAGTIQESLDRISLSAVCRSWLRVN
jgi:glycosyltransferase involved in cell wall biosynthesis